MVEASIIRTILQTVSDLFPNWRKDIFWALVAAIILAVLFILLRKPFEYLKKLHEWLRIKIKQLIVFIPLLPRLLKISYENSRDYEKMIDFDPCNKGKGNYPYIKASDSTLSHIEFYFYITNRSIFNFKIERISMNILDQNYITIDKIDEAKEIDLPHQQVSIQSSFRRALPSDFIAKLKSLKEKCESQQIFLGNVNIYLKNKKSPIFCGEYFDLRIHPQNIHL
jgi:hypothetical protein